MTQEPVLMERTGAKSVEYPLDFSTNKIRVQSGRIPEPTQTDRGGRNETKKGKKADR